MFKFLVIQFVLFNLIHGAKLPSNLIKCKSTDMPPCIKNAVQDALPKFAKGIKSLNVPGIDPLIVPKLEIPGGKGVIKIAQVYHDSELIGLSKCLIDEITFVLIQNYMNYTFTCTQLRFRGNYEMNGQLLFFPVRGHGPMEIKLDNVRGSGEIRYKRTTEGENEYFRLGDSFFTIDAEHVSFDFKNLFNGNEELSQQINEVMNDNWRDVFDDLKDNYDKGFKVFTDHIVEQFFKQIPINEIFD